MSAVATGREGLLRHRLRRHADTAEAGTTRTDRPPRLVLRFAVVTALGLALAGALILAVIREIDQRQAVRAATDRAHFVSETFLRGAIEPADAAGSVSGVRRAELDRLIRRYVLIDGALRVSRRSPRCAVGRSCRESRTFRPRIARRPSRLSYRAFQSRSVRVPLR